MQRLVKRIGLRLWAFRAWLQQLVGTVRLCGAAARGRVDELWIGDSHAVLLNAPSFAFDRLGRIGANRFVWHLGPRLMFSIARGGWPTSVRVVTAVLGRLPNPPGVLTFSFGEIDVRCHLANRLVDGRLDTGFVATYVDRIDELRKRAGAETAVVVTPVPPSVDVTDHVAFPVVGTIEERLVAHRAICDALHQEVTAARPGMRVTDLTAQLAGTDGQLRSDLTDDGCHTNDAGREAVRRALNPSRA
ncbi:SGNH/GDSL hydrolase family protein [Nocardioides bizhenqiangii]|uniref:SGNH/GDSL hydrolase family protein n=1 Tax=Nocardioides bizhenqiangii TaxID=3095076 RepID=A0ABZ0ZRA1_9ACTN|nr:SGNH/GDSL hydrolase family protein [Nocardioides sp. HM61]WQQ26003.1 SGNH/GDSL hydrolase family protein [Nocardioides sp. HM61]